MLSFLSSWGCFLYRHWPNAVDQKKVQESCPVPKAGILQNLTSGIPYLRDIPILGYLFGGMSDDFAKTELIFLVTPKVINTRAEADAITKDFSARVDLIKELIRKKEP